MATLVKFLKDTDGDVYAYFPQLKADNNGNKTCYAHIGQHSACSPQCAKESKPATANEYADLLSELKSIGYTDLKIIDGRRSIDKIITPIDCKYGAPMGRADINECPREFHKGVEYCHHGHLFDCAVPMSSDSAYDRGGAYWGIGPSELRVRYNKSLTYVEFYSA